MAKLLQKFLCSECGDVFERWLGKCPSCGSFNTLKEFKDASSVLASGKKTEKGTDLTAINSLETPKIGKIFRISTLIEEMDRVLGGEDDNSGFFPASVTLFGGHPGIGKSTLALQIFLNLCADFRVDTPTFYFSGEESREQILNRAERIFPQKIGDQILGILRKIIFSTNALEDIITTIQNHAPRFVVIDSIQMVGLKDTSFGSISQIRENAEILVKLAKSTGTAILLIGHVTKNDELAGPKILEHLVDTVLYLEGERNSELRILRAPKNRFGSTLEVGIFEMRENGLQELKNPSEFFLSERAENAHGSVITVVRDGARNFLLELQVLTTKTNFGQPRRTSHGFDLSKFHLLLAVVSKFTPFPCDSFDAYLNVIGGIRVQDPSVDLAIIAAILSSRTQTEVPPDTVIFGEVGLSGEVRHVGSIESRIREAEKLGFKRVICPRWNQKMFSSKMEIVEVKTILEMFKILIKK